MFQDNSFFAGLLDGVGRLLSNAVNFLAYFLSMLMQQPFTIVIIVVLLLFTKRGGLKLGKAVDVTVGK